MSAVETLKPLVGIAVGCRALAISRATWHRRHRTRMAATSSIVPAGKPVRRHPRALSEIERGDVLATLHSERFMDRSPSEVYATLLDEGWFRCSIRSIYRILASADEVRERRNHVRRPAYVKPELLATRPNQVWSWDITKLKGPQAWTYFYLYVILDIFSRYVVGWLLADCENAQLATRLIDETVKKYPILPGTLTVHSDRGSPMTSKRVGHLLADLGITRSHSRPYVSDDNPFSEAQFKTLKYCPQFPDRFGSIEDAQVFCRSFFGWYNDEHRHSALGLMTPAAMHDGSANRILVERQATLEAAFLLHPERFVRGKPTPPPLPTAAWINPPVRLSRLPACAGAHVSSVIIVPCAETIA